MKFLRVIFGLSLLVILLLGCGQEQKPSPPVLYTELLWQGFPMDNPTSIGPYPCDFKYQFVATMDCLQGLGLLKEGYPSIVVVKSIDSCGGMPAVGCYSFPEERIYLSVDGVGYALPHEIIHWASGQSAHSSIYFSQCQTFY